MTGDPCFTRDAELDDRIREALVASTLQDIGYAYVLDLDRGHCGSYRAETNIYPASVIKVAIMAEAYHQFADGSLAPEQPVVIDAQNQTTTAEVTPLAPGYRASVQELVRLMITASDNIATNQLFDVLRRENVTAYMRGLGLATFFLGRKLSGSEPLIIDPEMTGRNRLPPEEIGRLLALIALDRLPGAAAQRAILEDCVHNKKLVPGLMPGDRFMHKTGETDDLSHDAGILVTAQGRRFVTVLYTTPAP
ncbi:MAG TPA: serine hydrolase, partial [Candidatus Eremiobacteraceae bacterium]|nr:serine hydrolase [Candidatus Eremiobacteraceae bacterium]